VFEISETILERDNVRVVIKEYEDFTSEKIELKDGDNWISVIGSNPNHSTLNFWSRNIVFSRSYSYRKRTEKKLSYELIDKDLSLNLDYYFEEKNIIHIRYKLSNNRKLFLSKILVNYAILLGSDPDYTWVPYLRPKEDLVMGDHTFRSPVIIYKKGTITFALIPDLEILSQNRPFQTFMDLNLKPRSFKGAPQVSYGFGNYKPIGHILFKHKPMKKWKIKANSNLTFGYYIIIFKNKSIQEILFFINDFLWQKYGKKLLNNNLAPQILPYDKNAEEGFKAIIERHKVWGNFTLKGEKCGGIWQTSWMGKKKTTIAFMSPEKFNLKKQMKKNMAQIVSEESLLSRIIMYFSNSPFWIKFFDKLTRTFPIIRRNAEIWFNAWFNNMRSAYGFRFFGEHWKDNNLIEKGDRIINLFLNIPSVRGISPSVILPASGDETQLSTIKGLKGFSYIDDYSIVDCTLSTYWAIKYSQDFKVKTEEVKRKAKELFELLKEIQDSNGEIPAYINFSRDNFSPIKREILNGSASSGAPLMFLTEYYKFTKDESVIPVAEKIAQFIQKEIIPEDKWHDFEPFFSCTHIPLEFYDDYTNKHVMNGLCIYWNAEGMKELYKITQNRDFLNSGERILAILSLFQQVWNIPYISYNTFGGFCSQNIDAELSDARQALFIRTYMEYYLLTGKKEYMERGIAVLRASWAMQILREYKEQCPGNIAGLSTLDDVDRGIVTENYGHSGNDLRVPGYWMPDWGLGTSLMGTSYTKKHFGDIFIDFKEKFIWGIDGIQIKSFEIDNNRVRINCELINGKNYIILKARDINQNIEIEINQKSLKMVEKTELERGYRYDLVENNL